MNILANLFRLECFSMKFNKIKSTNKYIITHSGNRLEVQHDSPFSLILVKCQIEIIPCL